MKRMYRAGAVVEGPREPIRWRIWVERALNSQSSMNSHRWNSELSLVSGMAWTSSTMESAMAFLNSKPPSSRSVAARNPTSTRCFCGYLRHSWRMAVTTTILNSSAISFMKEEICFMRRSTELSVPVLSRVVIAKVAMLRFGSLMSASMSSLHRTSAAGCRLDTSDRQRIAAYRRVGLGEDRKSCRTVMAGPRSRSSTNGSVQSAFAAS
mmetsp:Transcript_56919/g.128974  ORF Transcript_56919/g.128974 Transcript_56919/m.128974 type:complete len:209 (+) Transcript_56919:512-1138(+)